MSKPVIRNPVARSPLLRKGGPHTRSKTGQRVNARLSTRDAMDEWLEEYENKLMNKEETNGTPKKAPPIKSFLAPCLIVGAH